MEAKLDKQIKAKQLRKDGKSVPEIARLLSVSKSSASIWVRGIPTPEKFTAEFRTKKKRERERELALKRVARKPKTRLISGDGRWMIPAPPGYKGKTYIGGRYIYEHRYLMEKKLGRLLRPGEVVHHRDENKLNNADNNLQLKSRGQHSSDHLEVYREQKDKGFITLTCDWDNCHTVFNRRVSTYNSQRKKGQSKFFCCRSCQVKYQNRYQIKRR